MPQESSEELKVQVDNSTKDAKNKQSKAKQISKSPSSSDDEGPKLPGTSINKIVKVDKSKTGTMISQKRQDLKSKTKIQTEESNSSDVQNEEMKVNITQIKQSKNNTSVALSKSVTASKQSPSKNDKTSSDTDSNQSDNDSSGSDRGRGKNIQTKNDYK